MKSLKKVQCKIGLNGHYSVTLGGYSPKAQELQWGNLEDCIAKTKRIYSEITSSYSVLQRCNTQKFRKTSHHKNWGSETHYRVNLTKVKLQGLQM